MTEELEFIEQLLADAELEENKQSLAYLDLVAREIMKLEAIIEANFNEAAAECEIINTWALNKNAHLQEKSELLKRKLEAFMRELNQKTLDLPNAVLKLHKKPDRVEVKDLTVFLAGATKEMVTVVPEAVKPFLFGIKKAWKMSGRVPAGVEIIPGEEAFNITFKTKGGTYDAESEVGSAVE